MSQHFLHFRRPMLSVALLAVVWTGVSLVSGRAARAQLSPQPPLAVDPNAAELTPEGRSGPQTGTHNAVLAPPRQNEVTVLVVPKPSPFPTLPTLTGSLGLLHASTAEVGPAHQLRLGLHGQYFRANDFLIEGDVNQRLAGGLVVGYSLRKDIEIFGAILNSSNRNRRTRRPGDTDPDLIKTFGDLVLGGKWILPLSSAATFGVELGLKFLSGVSDLAVSPSSTSWWLGPLFTFDLRRAGRIPLPLRFHAGASFYADNSANLNALSGITRATKEVARFAYGVAPSRLRLALAVDAPLDQLFPRVPIVPFFEYHAAYVTSAADPDFQDYMTPLCDDADLSKQPCVENRDMHFVTLGVRGAVYRGITVDMGVDIRVRSPGFPYGPPVPPFNFIFGVSHPFDVDSLTRTVVVTRIAEGDGRSNVNGARTAEGHIGGTVLSATDDQPIAGALVGVTGRLRARAATDSDGGFVIWNVPAGPAELEIGAADFAPTKISATVTSGQAVVLAIKLLPTPSRANIHGRVSDSAGAGLLASIKFTGTDVLEFKTDAAGTYAATVPAGSYQVRVDAHSPPGAGGSRRLVAKTDQLDVQAGQDKQLDFVLRDVTVNPNVTLSGDRMVVKDPIRFIGATAKPTPATEQLLDGVADLLGSQAENKSLRIIAHWDSSLPKPKALALTKAQADAVRAHLISRGIAQGRLTPTGEGAARPLVPNLTPANRARNRRVELRLE